VLLVVADTGPIHYLVEIGHVGILPQLFQQIFIPSLVYDELRHPFAPASVRAWVDTSPKWLHILPVTPSDDPALERLDDGEKSALRLGMTLGADLILIDDRKGAAVALQKGFQITGTLGSAHTVRTAWSTGPRRCLNGLSARILTAARSCSTTF
jgi:predicted nucleic acid-binding protein